MSATRTETEKGATVSRYTYRISYLKQGAGLLAGLELEAAFNTTADAVALQIASLEADARVSRVRVAALAS
jgi:hypothetical protein